MKTILLTACLFAATLAFSQQNSTEVQHKSIVVDNEKMMVEKYVGIPGEAVCGKGEHHHEAHLTVALTDASVLITTPEGKTKEAEFPAGAAIWSEAGIHSAKNIGENITKFLLVYIKEQGDSFLVNTHLPAICGQVGLLLNQCHHCSSKNKSYFKTIQFFYQN